MRAFLCFGAAVLLAVACSDDEDPTTGSNSSSTSSTASAGASVSSASTGTASGGGGAGGSQDCDPACATGLECCDGMCVNKGNDILNCGSCGNTCGGTFPFCDNGTCGEAPCTPNTTCSGITNCCGNQCCDMGDLCCVVPGGPQAQPLCTPPTDLGTCPVGCLDCP